MKTLLQSRKVLAYFETSLHETGAVQGYQKHIRGMPARRRIQQLHKSAMSLRWGKSYPGKCLLGWRLSGTHWHELHFRCLRPTPGVFFRSQWDLCLEFYPDLSLNDTASRTMPTPGNARSTQSAQQPPVGCRLLAQSCSQDIALFTQNLTYVKYSVTGGSMLCG